MSTKRKYITHFYDADDVICSELTNPSKAATWLSFEHFS